MKIVLSEFVDDVNSFTKYIHEKGMAVDEFHIVALEPK